jgi:hypothetical protein
VVEYETVLANGSIVNIKASDHKDLVRAMRGGGSQFGVSLSQSKIANTDVSRYCYEIRGENLSGRKGTIVSVIDVSNYGRSG